MIAMGVTGNTLKAALAAIPGGLSGSRPWTFDQLAAGADDAMKRCGISTKEGAAAFLATCCIESAFFRTTVEYTSSYTRNYDPYRGRSLVQVTLRDNYRDFGAWMAKQGRVPYGNYFLDNPTKLGNLEYAWDGAVWYFQKRFSYRGGTLPLYEIANRGDMTAVSGAVNRGSTTLKALGENERNAAYRALLRAGITAPGPAAFRYDMPDFDGCWTVRRIQRNVGVPDDGVYGPATRDAVKKAQKKLGVKTDGLWGEKTQDAMVKAQRAGTYPRPEKTQSKPPKKDRPKREPWRYDMPKGGMSVKQVQRAVGVKADGIYGSSTRKAVNELQRKLKVSPRDGLWGPSTERAYKRSRRKDGLLERGDRGRKVKKLQRKMNKVFPAYSDLAVDGIYGPAVEKVVREFQRRAGLTADGIVGPATKRALARSGVKI